MSGIPQFQRRVLTEAMRLIHVPGTHLLDTFYAARPPLYLPTRYAEIHILRGGRKMAAFVEPHLPAHVSERTGFTAGTFKTPYLKEKRPIKPGDLTQIQPGQIVYDARSPGQQLNEVIAQDLTEIKQMFTRREEWMARAGLLFGAVHVVGEGVDATITFPALATHRPTLSGADLWDHPDCDPIVAIRNVARLIQLDSGKVANVAFFGKKVVDSFLANPKVRAYFDMLKVDIGYITHARETAGNNARIRIAHVEGIDIYEAREWVTDPDSGETVPLIPDDGALIGATAAENRRHFGLIEDIDAITQQPEQAITDYYVKSWIEPDPSVRWLLAQSSPLPVPHDIDASWYAEVLGYVAPGG